MLIENKIISAAPQSIQKLTHDNYLKLKN